ncbi:hypothetical protein ACFLZ7_00035 [Nanoarchaeota archaeon]
MTTNLFETWVEVLFLIFFVLGIVLSITINNSFLAYFILFLIGLICGRIIYIRYKVKPTYGFAFYLTLGGLLLGYLLGVGYGNWKLLIVIFLIGIWVGHYIHKKGYLKVTTGHM